MPETKEPTLNKASKAEKPVDEEPKDEPGVVPIQTEPEPQPTSIKVKYVGGQGIELAYPLSNGLRSFVAGKVYELKNYGDYCRLIEASKHFVEVKEESAR
jgi:hypothetical protein